MSVTRRAQVVLGVLVAVVIAGGWTWTAQAQTTSTPTTSATTEASTSTTRAATTTSRASSTTTTTTKKPTTRLTFTASPTVGPPGTTITVSSVNQCRGTGSFYVLLSIGPTRLGSGPADNVGNWHFNVTVPQIQPGTYGLAATCLISRNGVDENAGIYVGPDFAVRAGSGGPPEPTTPASSQSSSSNTALIIGLIVAVVIAVAAIAWALWLRSKHKKELAAAQTGPVGGPTPPGGPPAGGGPGSAPPDTFA
jgi:flagellar basal body-associated protein FliL